MRETGRQSGLDPGRIRPDKLTTDTGRERPGSQSPDDPDARQAGSLTPLSAPIAVSFERPGRHKSPAVVDANSGPSIGSCEPSRPGRLRRDDRRVRSRRHQREGPRGRWPAGYRSPSSAPLLADRVTRKATSGTGDKKPRREGGASRATIGGSLNDGMELSDFVIGETFWTQHGAFRCTDIGTRVVVAVKLGPREVSRAESVDGELRITKRIDDDPSWLNGPPYAVEEVVFDENERGGCFRSEAEVLGDGEAD